LGGETVEIKLKKNMHDDALPILTQMTLPYPIIFG